MVTKITKALINEGLAVTSKEVSLRDGEYLINVRKLTADETITFIELNDTEDRSKQLNVMATLVATICVDDDGKKLFDDDQQVTKLFTLEDMTLIVSAATGMEAESVEGKSAPSSAATA